MARQRRRFGMFGIGIVTAGVLLGACGSGQPSIPPFVGIGVSPTAGLHFFKGIGGGPFKPGTFTGGLVGPAASGPAGKTCDLLMQGTTTAIGRITMFCDAGPTPAAASQLEDVLKKTIHRFAPASTSWASRAVPLAVYGSGSPADATSSAGGILVQLVTSGTPAGRQVKLTINQAAPATGPSSAGAGGN